MKESVQSANAPQSCKKLIQGNYVKKLIIPVLIALNIVSIIPGTISTLLASSDMTIILLPSLLPFGGLLLADLVLIGVLIARWRNPVKSKLGKMALLCAGESVGLQEVFQEIDEDIAQSGKVFGKVYIGDKWVVGRSGLVNATAMKKDRIQAIFYVHIIRQGKRTTNNYHLHLFEEGGEETSFRFYFQNELEAAFNLLCAQYPNAYHGYYEDLKKFRAMSVDERQRTLC